MIGGPMELECPPAEYLDYSKELVLRLDDGKGASHLLDK